MAKIYISNNQLGLVEAKKNNNDKDILAVYLTERFVSGVIGKKGDTIYCDNKKIVIDKEAKRVEFPKTEAEKKTEERNLEAKEKEAQQAEIENKIRIKADAEARIAYEMAKKSK